MFFVERFAVRFALALLGFWLPLVLVGALLFSFVGGRVLFASPFVAPFVLPFSKTRTTTEALDRRDADIAADIITESAMVAPYGFVPPLLGGGDFVGLADAGYANYGAILVRAKDGEVLFSEGGERRVLPASLTKMVSLYAALLAICEGAIGLHDLVPISYLASLQPPTKVGFAVGSKVSTMNLLAAMLLLSSNDAAVALADALGGACKFVERMNALLPSLDMLSSKFANPAGLNEWICVDGKLVNRVQNGGNYTLADALLRNFTTPSDMAKVLIALGTRFPDFKYFFSTPYFVWRGNVYASSNNVGRYLKGGWMGKTGHTAASGYNLAAAMLKDGSFENGVVAVVSGFPNRFQRDDYAIKLLELGGLRVGGGGAFGVRGNVLGKKVNLAKERLDFYFDVWRFFVSNLFAPSEDGEVDCWSRAGESLLRWGRVRALPPVPSF